jgi:hypothetical protein
MPVFNHFPVPKSGSGGIENVTTQSITTGASGAEIALGPRQYFMITAFAAATPTAASNINLKFGAAGLSAATASDMGLPVSGPGFSVAPAIFGMGEEFTSIRIFNNTSATVVIYVMLLNIAG